MNESTISMLLGILVVVVVGVLLFNYFRSARPESQLDLEAIKTEEGIELEEKEGRLVPKGLPASHTVAAGENLWAIAEKYYGSGYNWVDIAAANNLANPNQLLVGQELMIPQAEVIKPVDPEPVVAGISITGQSYIVEKGDNLWEIAVRAYGDGYKWAEVWQANQEQIADPNLIEIGMELSLPR